MRPLLSIFKRGLQKTGTSISRNITGLFSDIKTWDKGSFEKLERDLVAADFGSDASRRIVSDIRDRYERGLLKGADDMVATAKSDISSLMQEGVRPLRMASEGMTTILLVGVNGSGKTTTAGKLAHKWIDEGRKVSLAACDTFRAAATEQLKLWSERTGANLTSSKHGADPAAVAYDAVQSALARQSDILIIDTAGRQHTKKGLMDELAKIKRIIAKLQPEGPHETLLTIDSSIGLNAICQAREFAACAGVTGLVLTKLDGTGKGGAAVVVQHEFRLPILFVGLGEQPDDLQPFDPQIYAEAIFSGN